MVKIIDIANKLDISRAQVARALNNYGYVNEEKKKLITKTAEKMGYIPNIAAKSLTTQKNYHICYYFPLKFDYVNLMQSYLFYETFTGIRDYAVKHFYRVTVVEKMTKKSLSRLKVDGFISHYDISKELNIDNLPSVLLVNSGPYCVYSTNENAIKKTVELIVKSGRKKIYFIAHNKSRFQERVTERHKKLKLYERYFNEYGVQFKPENIIYLQRNFNTIYDDITTFLNQTHPDLIISLSDTLAVEVIRISKVMGIRIPDDLAIIGYDNAPFTSEIVPELTTINKPRYQLGTQAAKMLIQIIENKKTLKKPKVQLKCNLVRRDTF